MQINSSDVLIKDLNCREYITIDLQMLKALLRMVTAIVLSFSPDGTKIAFVSAMRQVIWRTINDNGTRDIFIKDLKTG